MERSVERTEFLSDVLVTAIESGSSGWFVVDEYEPDGPDAHAVIRADDEPGAPRRVTLGTIAHGLAIIRDARPRPVEDGVLVLHNAGTGQRLYMSYDMRRRIMLADRTNGDDGDLDVVDALAILECALFGAVTYC
jgi:hypothetical protein